MPTRTTFAYFPDFCQRQDQGEGVWDALLPVLAGAGSGGGSGGGRGRGSVGASPRPRRSPSSGLREFLRRGNSYPPDIIEDACQQAIADFLRLSPEMRAKIFNPRAYLRGSAANIAARLWRKRQRFVPIEEVPESHLAVTPPEVSIEGLYHILRAEMPVRYYNALMRDIEEREGYGDHRRRRPRGHAMPPTDRKVLSRARAYARRILRRRGF